MAALICALGLMALGLMWLMATEEDTRDALLCAIGAALLVIALCALLAWLGPDAETGAAAPPWSELPSEGTI